MDVEPALAGLGLLLALVVHAATILGACSRASASARRAPRALAVVVHARRRDDRLPPDPARVVVPVVLPRGRSPSTLDRPRLGAAERRRRRSLTIAVILAGLAIFGYAGARIVEAIARGVLTGVLAERRRERAIRGLRDHFIICGYGRVGRRVAEEFRGRRRAVRRARHQRARRSTAAQERGDLLIEGTRHRATTTCSAPGSTARAASSPRPTPTPTTSTSRSRRARAARPDDRRARLDEEAERKLRLAGADRVVQPYAAAGHGDGEARAEAAGGGVPRARHDARPGPTCASRRSRSPRLPAGGQDDPRPAHPARDRRGDHRAAQAGRHLRRDAEPGRADRGRRRADRDRHRPRAAAARGPVRDGRPLPADPVTRLEAALGELAGATVALERPKDPTHGDYATNVALQLARARRRPPRELAAGARRAGGGAARGRARRGRRARASSTSGSPTRVRRRARRDLTRRRYGGGSRGARSASRSRWCPRTRPGRSPSRSARNGAYGDSVARLLEFAGHEVEREYYYNDAGRADGPVPRLGRGGAARRGAARGRLPAATTSPSSRREPGDPVPAMLEQIEATLERFRIHFDSWAKQSELEPRAPGAAAAARHVRGGRDALGADDRVRRRQGPAARSARPTAADLTSPPTSRTSSTSSSAASTARSTCSAPTTTATSRGSRRRRAMLGYDPDARRGAALPARPPDAGRRAGEDVEAARRRRLPRRLHRRGRRRRRPLVPRRPRPRPDDRDRRRPRGREVAEEPRLLRPVRARADRRDPPRTPATRAVDPSARASRSRRRSASSSSGSPSSRRSCARRPSGAGRTRSRSTRSGSPTTSTASTTSTACSRAASEAFRLALCRATQTRDRARLDLVGVDAPERM